MAQVILLGTGAALSDACRENTYLVIQGQASSILVDCAGSPAQRLLRSGVTLDSIEHLVLTHHHPDHLYGLSVFLLDLWLSGRNKPLEIHGLPSTLRAVRGMMHAFEWEKWRKGGLFPVHFNRVCETGPDSIIATSEFSATTAPTKHLLPSIALRVTSNKTGGSIAYSGDTMVCPSVVALADHVDILFHEATTIRRANLGHSSALQAGAQARRAGAKKLVLVHLPPNGTVEALETAASSRFDGPVVVADDMMRFPF